MFRKSGKRLIKYSNEKIKNVRDKRFIIRIFLSKRRLSFSQLAECNIYKWGKSKTTLVRQSKSKIKLVKVVIKLIKKVLSIIK